ncbi:MAG: hypothetical protein JTJ11_05785 [Collinsella sp.]|nr:hypothetical protein [Collinsella sp.]
MPSSRSPFAQTASACIEQFAQKATCEGGFFYAAKDELSDSVIINQGMGKEQQAPRAVLVYRL